MRLLSVVLLLVTFLLSLSNAQVYIGSSGPYWNGTCANSCPQSAPCQLLSAGATTMDRPCVLYFESGLTIPAHFLFMDVVGNVTLSSLGPVSLGGALRVENRGGGIVLQDFTSSGPNMFRFTSPETYILESSVTITDASQISLVGGGGSLVVIRNSNFTTTSATLMSWDLAAGATGHLSGVKAELSQGLSTMASAMGNEPTVHIHDSTITGLMFSGTPLKDISLENVTGTLLTSTSVFEQAPVGFVTILDSNLGSTSNSWLMGLGDVKGLRIARSHFENVVVRGAVEDVLLENSTFTLNQLYDPVILLTSLYKAKLKNLSITSRTSFGTAPVLSSLSPGMGFDLEFSDLVYSSPSSVPRMSVGGFIRLTANVVFPSLSLSSGVFFYGTFTPEFSGDIITSVSSAPVTFTESVRVIFHSISFGTGVSFSQTSNPEFAYRVTKPSQGILCADQADCVNQPLGTATRIIWDSSLPLPVVGEAYPYINSSRVTLFVSDFFNYTLSTSSEYHVPFFTFHELPPLAPVEVTPIDITPSEVSTPSGNSPSLITPTQSPSSAPSSSPSTDTPTSTPSSAIPTTASPDSPSSPVPTTASSDSPTSSATHQAAGWCISLGLVSLILL